MDQGSWDCVDFLLAFRICSRFILNLMFLSYLCPAFLPPNLPGFLWPNVRPAAPGPGSRRELPGGWPSPSVPSLDCQTPLPFVRPPGLGLREFFSNRCSWPQALLKVRAFSALHLPCRGSILPTDTCFSLFCPLCPILHPPSSLPSTPSPSPPSQRLRRWGHTERYWNKLNLCRAEQ